MLSAEEIQRYSRHLTLPEVGLDGQARLRAARVLCVGAGGLGSPALLYLAAAGVGHLTIVDYDQVEVSNLQRQVMFGASSVGGSKLAAARDRLADLNPHVSVDLHEGAFAPANALALVTAHDLVVDGTDNFPARYLVNDACVLAGRPNVYGSILRFEGQASVFATADGPCYRCLHPEPPPPDVIPSCAEAGVLGVLPGVIGSIQATEAIKLILGIGESLAGRILIYDALRLRFREVRLRRAPDCPVCSPRRTIRTLSAYRAACEPAAGDGGELPEVGARELSQARQAGAPIVLLDVREPGEHAICRIEGARLLPLAGLPGGVADLDRNADLVVFCKSGVRSASAVRYLRQEGFTRARNLRGGIVAWINEVDPTLATY